MSSVHLITFALHLRAAEGYAHVACALLGRKRIVRAASV